jgi:regulator of replication initiation timing
MNEFKEVDEIDVYALVEDLKSKNKENEMLKKALAKMAIENEILQTANEVLKKVQPKLILGRPRK